jgi:hypothetical protein
MEQIPHLLGGNRRLTGERGFSITGGPRLSGRSGVDGLFWGQRRSVP